MSFKQHLDMIGRNESPTKKAKFWQSYVRSLKGSDDIRAHDTPRINSWRPLSTDLLPLRSIYDEPTTASERIVGPGYRYLPVHRETYGYSPRPIYAHHYGKPTGDYNAYDAYDAERQWQDHLRRMKAIERRYPSRYGLYLKDRPNTVVVPLEYEPEDKPISSGYRAGRSPSRAGSVPPLFDSPTFSSPPFSSLGVLPRDLRATSIPPLPSKPLSPLDLLSEYERRPFERSLTPTPIKYGRWAPRRSEVAFDYDGLPVFNLKSYYNSLDNLLNPRASLPPSSFTRDPFFDDDLLGLRSFRATSERPPFWRDSHLSSMKRRYLWKKHSMRPFAHNWMY